ncbi:hypothetical protein LROSL1_0277 [Furfurilactobacillus rossiae]|uniref:hypothetical protein n=1 Tax=Furfurilactobacillus rossiae TaxID=231049 RepID=UPI0015BD47EA|nr:hypothetical protein [Furfurilactobacillus rossiae]MCF6165779.1 hypothetical protein [Furfurilactobacillus rossiae]QLE63097.1 hypothetical protein LROSL1_0277 [Furfurilactobacillus rossiae]
MNSSINQNGDHNHATINQTTNITYFFKNTTVHTNNTSQGNSIPDWIVYVVLPIVSTFIKSYGLLLNSLQRVLTPSHILITAISVAVILYLISFYKTKSWKSPLGIVIIVGVYTILFVKVAQITPSATQMNVYANMNMVTLFQLIKGNGLTPAILFPIIHTSLLALIATSVISSIYTTIRFQRVGTWASIVVFILAVLFIYKYQQFLDFNPANIKLPVDWPSLTQVLQQASGL